LRPLNIPILQMEQAQKPHSHQEAGEIKKKKKEAGDINKWGWGAIGGSWQNYHTHRTGLGPEILLWESHSSETLKLWGWEFSLQMVVN